MRKTLRAAMMAIAICALPVAAQTVTTDSVAVDSLVAVQPAPIVAAPLPTVGVLSYDSLLLAMPEYADVLNKHAELVKQYEAEAVYNETNFKRKFSEFLQGQKDFPQNILLKRQRDLQEEMEKAMAFRHASDSLLREAKAEMLAPVKAKLDAAIRAVGVARGYKQIVNSDAHAVLFLAPGESEPATSFVLEQLSGATE